MAKLTSDQFAQQIKQKYPAYQNVDNVTLTQKMLAKYPQYANQVDLGQITQQTQSNEPQGYFNKLGQQVVGFFKGAGRSAEGIFNMANQSSPTGLISSAVKNVPILNKLYPEVPQLNIPGLEATNQSQKIGGYFETAAEFIAPIAYEAATTDLVSNAGKLVNEVKNFSIGKEGVKTLEKLDNPEAQQFIKNGKMFDSVVNDTSKAVDKFTEMGKQALEKVKQAIPKVQIPEEDVGTKVSDGIMNSLKKSAAYKGVESDVSLFKNPKELINSGILNQDEVKSVNGMVKAINNWSDYSARGILNLKTQLSTFYDAEQGGSNAILSGIQNGLKDLVGQYAPEIKPALAKASEAIDLGEQFIKNFVGKDSVQGESKLSTIARNLKNPAAQGEKLDLINKLKQYTGYDAMPALKGYSDYLDLLAKGLPSKAGTIVKGVGKTIGIPAGIAGGVTAGADAIYKLFGGK